MDLEPNTRKILNPSSHPEAKTFSTTTPNPNPEIPVMCRHRDGSDEVGLVGGGAFRAFTGLGEGLFEGLQQEADALPLFWTPAS